MYIPMSTASLKGLLMNKKKELGIAKDENVLDESNVLNIRF